MDINGGIMQLLHGRKLHAAVFAALALSLGPVVSAQGTSVGSGYWHTGGNQILDSQGNAVRLAGVNWYGFETPDFLAHGLWAQDYKTVLNNLKALGYNVIRMPFSNQMVESNPVPTNFTMSAGGVPANTALVGQTALQDMDTIIAYAGSIGLRVILDNHRSEAGASNEQNGLWYTSAFPHSSWVADWQTMAMRYSDPKFTFNGNPTVIGMDLRNEPHVLAGGNRTGACWTGDTATAGCPTFNTAQNWPLAATEVGDAFPTSWSIRRTTTGRICSNSRGSTRTPPPPVWLRSGISTGDTSAPEGPLPYGWASSERPTTARTSKGPAPVARDSGSRLLPPS
jgi:aryl-phospho-beta-D-glucosidase BglC (GH1 family)